ncbi:MAG: hypothetical protein K5919_04610 [Clostridiales bacterium]|nr:hypothetical protein [Clostridiales bacterium]
MEKEANRTALNIEEAALLPAMPPKAMTGGAALRGVRQEENRMREMTVGEERAWNSRGRTAVKRKETQVNRAALKHVMRKR